MGTESFSEVKRSERDVNHPPHLAPRLKKEYSYNLLPLWTFVAFVQGELYLSLYRHFIYVRPKYSFFNHVNPRCFLKKVTWISGKCCWRVFVNKHRYFADHWRCRQSVTSSWCEHCFSMRSSADKTPTHDKRCILGILGVVRSYLYRAINWLNNKRTNWLAEQLSD